MNLPSPIRELPIAAVLPDVLDALARPGATAVVAAEPGAGKTTGLPLALLDAPWRRGRVIVTQPRRVAARAATRRVASLLGGPVGATAGWRMRGDTKVSAATRLEFVTDGVLTRMLHADPGLDGVDVVVFDEFHERSLDTDLGLALCLDCRRVLRPDLRVVVMSATVDTASVAALLGDAAVFDAPGRTFPVDTEWLTHAPPAFDARTVAEACRRALVDTRRDVLVFVPGAAEIRATVRALDGVGADVRPLHGSLTTAEQDRALAPSEHGHRKIVVATAVAETSLTIDGVDAVVDSGWARRARDDSRRAMTTLVTTRVSRASADQRRGRAGRTSAGRCYRLWSQVDHERLAPFDDPEIRVADLTPLALDLVRWGDPDGTSLRWTDPPALDDLRRARALLHNLGVLDPRDRLTDHGRLVAELPLHPRLGHALLAAHTHGHGALACDVVALLGEGDVRSGGPGADLDSHLRAARARDRRASRRLKRMLGITDEADPDDAHAGFVVALAYPERIAQRRGRTNRYLLASGAGAELGEHDSLQREELLAVAELDHRPGRTDARIVLAAALSSDDLDLAAGERVSEHDVIEWDRRAGDVRAERQRRLGSIVLRAQRADDPPAATGALLTGIRTEGLELLPRLSDAEAWRSRVAFCRRVLGTSWPDVSDEALLARLDEWVAPALVGASRRVDLASIDVVRALRGLVPGALLAQLDVLAPDALTLPGGSRRRVDYTGDAPVIELRVQEAFGWDANPRIADGRAVVALRLLSPAGRPVQTTSDLAGFWRGSYRQVRTELRGRYPKHAWPEEPWLAPAVSSRGTARRGPSVGR